MSYLVDTDWIVDALLGRPTAETLLGDLAADGLAISLITYGEIYEGIYSGRDPSRAELASGSFSARSTFCPLTDGSCSALRVSVGSCAGGGKSSGIPTSSLPPQRFITA